MRIQNGILMTMEGTPIPCGYVDFAEGKITGCGAMEDALAALAVLGYPRAVAVAALQGVNTAGMATDEIVRAALKRLF